MFIFIQKLGVSPMFNHNGRWFPFEEPDEITVQYQKEKMEVKFVHDEQYEALCRKAKENKLAIDLAIPLYVFLKGLIDNDGTIEVRGIHKEDSRTTAAYLSAENLVDVVIDSLIYNLDMGFNIYVSQGVLPSAKFPTSGFSNRKSYAKASDYCLRLLLAIDIDPIRGLLYNKKRYATKEEKESAFVIAQKVKEELVTNEVPCCIAASGNGYYVLINIRNEDSKAAKVQDFITYLKSKYDTEKAKIDETTASIGCIIRAFGTRNWSYPFGNEFRFSFGLVPPRTEGQLLGPFVIEDQEPEHMEEYFDEERLRNAPEHDVWLRNLHASIDLGLVYGQHLTGRTTKTGDLLCRDPFDEGSLKMGVVSIGGQYERGRFYSFGRQEPMSLVYFYQRLKGLGYREACNELKELSNIHE